MAEKLIAEVTVKMTEGDKRFARSRAEQLGMPSASEYMRHLLDSDKTRAESDLKLLADSLGLKVIPGIGETDA